MNRIKNTVNNLCNKYKPNYKDPNLETVDHCRIDKKPFLYPVRKINKNQDKLKGISLKSRTLLILFKININRIKTFKKILREIKIKMTIKSNKNLINHWNNKMFKIHNKNMSKRQYKKKSNCHKSKKTTMNNKKIMSNNNLNNYKNPIIQSQS